MTPPNGEVIWTEPGQRVVTTSNPGPPLGTYLNGVRDSYGATSLSNLADIATLRCQAKMDQRDLDLGTAWVEREKTAQLVADTAHTMVRALNAIRRRDGRGLLNELGLDLPEARARGFVDAWNAYQYGVKPLLNDVLGSTSALARMPPETWGFRASVKREEPLHGKFAYKSDYAGWILKSEGYRRAVAVITAVQRPLTRQQDLLWALGLDNPLATYYELIPYSFVLDWMLPIGEWLQAMNAIKYYNGYQRVTITREKESFNWLGHTYKLGGTTVESRGSGAFSRDYHNRAVTNSPLVVLPVKDPRSLDHMANALSLLAANTANSVTYDRILRV